MDINFIELKRIIDIVPDNLDRKQKKGSIPSHVRRELKESCPNCVLCGHEQEHDKNGLNIIHIHHIIPNGSGEKENLIALCKYCHQTIHLLLYAAGKWRYVDVNKTMPYQ